MNDDVFRYLSELIYRESGIVLPAEKAMLLGNRIQKRLRALGLSNEEEYLQIIEVDETGQELVELIDVVSTNTTYFYREPKHFEMYGEILSELKAAGRTEIKVWCAAASSGEEPYTLAIETLEQWNRHSAPVKILATDICTAVLRRALTGIYRSKAIENTPSHRRDAYFEEYEPDDEGEPRWKISDKAAALVMFKKLNLVQFPYPLRGPLDIIFCRNVMIYFDLQTRERIVGAFYELLRPGGFLFLSHSENLLGIQHRFKRTDNSAFRKE